MSSFISEITVVVNAKYMHFLVVPVQKYGKPQTNHDVLYTIRFVSTSSIRRCQKYFSPTHFNFCSDYRNFFSFSKVVKLKISLQICISLITLIMNMYNLLVKFCILHKLSLTISLHFAPF